MLTVEDTQQPEHGQEAGRDKHDRWQVVLHPPEAPAKSAHEQSDGKEREVEFYGIDAEQSRAGEVSTGGSCDSEDRGENGADASRDCQICTWSAPTAVDLQKMPDQRKHIASSCNQPD